MRKIIVHLFDSLIQKLEKGKKHFSSKKTAVENHNYFQLSPIQDTEQSSEYIEALSWAIDNRKEKDIKNIALTGPYGAGKSSILKTFQQKCNNPELHFLNISLATFKEEDAGKQHDTGSTSTTTSDNQLDHKLRQIEVSILQQIFYHEEDNKIPDSRFKKIRASNKKELTTKSVSILLALLSIYWLIDPPLQNTLTNNIVSKIAFFKQLSLLTFLLGLSYLILIFLKDGKRIKKIYVPASLLIINAIVLVIIGGGYLLNKQSLVSYINFVSKTDTLLTNFSIVYLFAFIYSLIKEVITFLNKISVNKLKIQSAEIEINSKYQKSIMNQHLDEILYFFSVRPYNVIIIEDLDRFKQTEVFTKLREINLLLNQSEKTKDKNIVFIYAVRDEMFQDKDRTKFFDFIIPIIPTINSSNSSQILLSKNRTNHYGLTESFIENVSFIIDDMRLLHNICNEFYLYKKLLSEHLNSEKLFAIIAYKNILPTDFVQLSQNDGFLYKLLNKKKDFVATINAEIDNKIKELNVELENLESNYFDNVADLRRVYILKLIEKLDSFNSFVINGNTITFDDLVKDENFEYVLNSSIQYNKTMQDGYYSLTKNATAIDIKFTDLEKNIPQAKQYKKIKTEIESKQENRIFSIKAKLKDLENQKTINRARPLLGLLQDYSFRFEETELLNEKAGFLFLFLRRGYITEDYIEYISIFREGSISRGDHSFYINVQNRISQEYNYTIDRVENLINKLSLSDFKSECVFNFTLLDFLLKNKEVYETHLNNLIDKLKDESEKSVSFILSCYENLNNIEDFTIELTRNWNNFWTTLSNRKSVEESLLNEIFIATIQFSEIESLKKISKNNNYIQKISSDALFLNIIQDVNRIESIIGNLVIDFTDIDFKNSPKVLSDYVYNNWNYAINIQNLESVIKFYGEFDQLKFNTSNYKSIIESGCDELISYIEYNIALYISNVYLLLPINTEEEEVHYIELLNTKDLNQVQFEAIISKVNTKIEDIDNIESFERQLTLLNVNKVKATWKNVFHFVKIESHNEESITRFLNIKENAEFLNNDMAFSSPDDSFMVPYKSLLEFENIIDECYKIITANAPWWYSTFNFAKINSKKAEILINNRMISPSKESFDSLKLHHKDLLNTFIEKNSDNIIKILDSLEIDSVDLEFILKSKTLPEFVKNKFLRKINEDDVIENPNNLLPIAEIVIKDSSFEISKKLILAIFSSDSIEYRTKIKVFNRYSKELDIFEIETFLINLPVAYAEIVNKERKALIDDNDDNRRLLIILENIGYISSFKEERNGLRVYHKKK